MNRLSRIATLTGFLVLLGSSATLAWCRPPVVREPEASICLTGDPRAYVTLDNTASNVDVDYKVVYKTGRDNAKRVIVREVQDGTAPTMRLWVHGGSSVVVRDNQTGELLARKLVTRSNVSATC